jgi:hypothetical protein
MVVRFCPKDIFLDSPEKELLTSLIPFIKVKIIRQPLFLKLSFAAFLALISTFQTANGAEWMKLADCRYVSNGINDGDSFMIKNR